jgi:hypothetical protein
MSHISTFTAFKYSQTDRQKQIKEIFLGDEWAIGRRSVTLLTDHIAGINV